MSEENEDEVVPSMSIFCSNLRCEPRFVSRLPSGGGGYENKLFVCSCLRHVTRDDGEGMELVGYALIEAERLIPEQMNIKNDSIHNIRSYNCHGEDCQTAYGDGLNVNCENCRGRSIIEIIRSGDTDYEFDGEEEDDGEEDEPEAIATTGKINAISFCGNVDCKIVFKVHKFSDDKDAKVVILCKCFDAWTLSEDDDVESDIKLITATKEVDESAPDSLSNLRQFSCNGWGCEISFGDGKHLHCTSCSGDVLTALRRVQVEPFEPFEPFKQTSAAPATSAEESKSESTQS